MHRRRFNCHAAGALHRIKFESEGFKHAALEWLGTPPITQLHRSRFAFSSTSWPTSRRLHAAVGDAENRGTVAASQPAGEADQDRPPRWSAMAATSRFRWPRSPVPRQKFSRSSPGCGRRPHPGSRADGSDMILRSERPRWEGCALSTGEPQVPAPQTERPSCWRPTGRLRSNILAMTPR